MTTNGAKYSGGRLGPAFRTLWVSAFSCAWSAQAEEAAQKVRFRRPRVEEDIGRNQSRRVSEGQGDDHNVVEGTDDRQELRDEVDR